MMHDVIQQDWHPQEVFKGMIGIAISSLKCVLIINGGAAGAGGTICFLGGAIMVCAQYHKFKVYKIHGGVFDSKEIK